MRKQRLFWPLMAAAAMIFASCNNNDIVPVDETVADATVKITIVSSPEARGITGNEAAIETESKINNFEAYSFNAAGAQTDYIAVPSSSLTGTTVSTTLKATAGQQNTIVVVTNTNRGASPTALIGSVASLTELKAKYSTQEFVKGVANTTVPAAGFVMTGTTTLTPAVGSNQASISVKRTVSKFKEPIFGDPLATPVTPLALDFTNVNLEKLQELFGATFTMSDVDKITFAYSAYVLANGLNKSLLLNEASYATTSAWGNRTWFAGSGMTYLNSEFNVSGDYIPTTGAYSGNFVSALPVYVHENFPYADFEYGNITGGYNPLEIYCFIIKGELTWTGATPAVKQTRYWRVNLVKETTKTPTGTDEDFYKVFRNGVYSVKVLAIKTVGHATPEDAEKETPIIPGPNQSIVTVIVDVAPWDVYVSNTEI